MFDRDLEDAMQVLKEEQERRQIMAIIQKIRDMGGANTLIVLAGYMMTAGLKDIQEKG